MSQIIKISGELEEFSEQKLYHYLLKIGLDDSQAGQIVRKVERPDSTVALRAKVADIIPRVAGIDLGTLMRARYLLKEAIYALGPAGFYFEQLIGKLFEFDGFQTEVGVLMKGRCVEHEVDVHATKPGEYHFVECKFHNKEGTRSDLVDVLYTKARFDDLHEAHDIDEPHQDFGWFATNTKLTNHALQYVECQGIKVFSLTKPVGERQSITDKIFQSKLYPITSLQTVKPHQDSLLAQGYITILDLAAAISASQISLESAEIATIQAEIAALQQ